MRLNQLLPAPASVESDAPHYVYATPGQILAAAAILRAERVAAAIEESTLYPLEQDAFTDIEDARRAGVL